MALHLTGDEHADQVLTDDPFALLVGMMLDQQYPMEHAFRGPAKVLDRFGTLEPARIAAADPEEFAALCSTPPAIHRFPGSMAARLQAVAALVEERYDGHAERLWSEAATGKELYARFCDHCHGDKGDGDGPVVNNGGHPPPGAYSGALKDLPEGKIFHVITYGKGMMGSHASQLNKEERWLVVQYVKYLQNGGKMTREGTGTAVAATPTPAAN